MLAHTLLPPRVHSPVRIKEPGTSQLPEWSDQTAAAAAAAVPTAAAGVVPTAAAGVASPTAWQHLAAAGSAPGPCPCLCHGLAEVQVVVCYGNGSVSRGQLHSSAALSWGMGVPQRRGPSSAQGSVSATVSMAGAQAHSPHVSAWLSCPCPACQYVSPAVSSVTAFHACSCWTYSC